MSDSPQVWNAPLDSYYVRSTEDADQKQIQHTLSGALSLRLDEASGTVSYVGEALPGTAATAAAWRIKKIDTTSGTSITWADAGRFTQIWNDRAGLTYA